MKNDTSIAPLELINLTKRYGKARGIENISLQLQPGEVFGFLGPNGAGKTTTIRTIMNFLHPSSGKVRVFGLESTKHSVEINKKVGYLAGDFELYDNLTGAQYLDFMSHLYKIDTAKKTRELTDRLGVTLHQQIRTLSRGNKQKIGLVAALMHDPDILLLDEPTSGLDPLMQNEFYELVREHSAKGRTVFISSHILSEVEEICSRVGFMREGSLVKVVDMNSVRNQSKKDITIVCKTGTKPMHLPHFKNLEILEETKERIRFLTSEPIKEVLGWLAMQPVSDVLIKEASLDDMFLELYNNKEVPTHV